MIPNIPTPGVHLYPDDEHRLLSLIIVTEDTRSEYSSPNELEVAQAILAVGIDPGPILDYLKVMPKEYHTLLLNTVAYNAAELIAWLKEQENNA